MACFFQYLLLASLLLVLASAFANEERQKKEKHGRKDELKTHNFMILKDNRRKPSLRTLYRSYQTTKKPAESTKSNMVYRRTPKPGTLKILPVVNDQKVKENVERNMKINKSAVIKAGLFQRYVQSPKAKTVMMEIPKKEHDRTIPVPFIESNILPGQDEYGLSGETKLFTGERGAQDMILQSIEREKLGEKIKEMIEDEQRMMTERNRLRMKERAGGYVLGVTEGWKAGQEKERDGDEMGRMFGKEKVIDGKMKIVKEGMDSEGMRKEEHRVNVAREGKVEGVGVVLEGVNEGGPGVKQEEEGKYAIHRVGREKEGLFRVTKERVNESEHRLNSRKHQDNEVQIEEQDKAVLRGINDGILSEMIIDRVNEGGRVMTGTEEGGRMEEYRKVDGDEIENERMEMKKGEGTLGSKAVLAALSGEMMDKQRMIDRVKEGERMITRSQEDIEEMRGYGNQREESEYMGSGTQENWMEEVE